MAPEPSTILGCGVAIWRDGRILLGKRRNIESKPGGGLYSMPGGKVDAGEWPAKAAAREVMEETGLQVVKLEPLPGWHWTDKWTDDGTPWLTLYFEAQVAKGEPVNTEPEKHHDWEWFEPDKLPFPLWTGIEDAVRARGRRDV